MRIKIIERLIPISEIYSTVQKVLNSHFTISENSIISQDYLLILAVSETSFVSVIHASLDKNFERTYLSTMLLKIQSLAKILDIQYNSKEDINDIEDKLIQALNIEENDKILYPFTEFSKFQLVQDQENRDISTLESKIISTLLKHLYTKIGYSDEIMKFPFSITYMDGKREEWEEKYHPYINSIEKRIKENSEDTTKIYRNYDFALDSDIFQRMFDLLILSTYEAEAELNGAEEDEGTLYNYEVTFIYCNKTSQPYTYMNLLKLMNEINKFADKFKKDKSKKCNIIRSQIILISLSGYELKIKNYLRDHLFRESDHAIPLLTVPPINNEVWHNLFDYDDLINSKQKKREELGKIINISKQQQVSNSFRATRLKNATSEYEEIIERERIAKLDKDFLKKWYWILNVPESCEILNLKKENGKLNNSMKLMKENLEIY